MPHGPRKFVHIDIALWLIKEKEIKEEEGVIVRSWHVKRIRIQASTGCGEEDQLRRGLPGNGRHGLPKTDIEG